MTEAANEDDAMQGGNTRVTGLGRALLTSKLAQVGELAVVFLVALAVIMGAGPLAGENPLARQGVVWVANVLMLVMVWLGLRVRGQGWGHFGLSLRLASRRTVVRAVLLSFAVFVAGVAAFVLGAVVMANIVGTPEGADMSGYDYLHGNLPMLILALVAVYIVSSFGEEVIYRAFLINRIAELGSGGKAAWRLAVVISSIVFGLVHVDWGLAGIVQTGFMGLVLGVSYLLVRRNLWVTILAHGYMDTILILQMYFAAGQGVAD
jgi:membrane protease YdiL (CAAX protease family)